MSSSCVTCSGICILSLSFHPCWILGLFLCFWQGKSVGLFQTELNADTEDFYYLANCKMLSTNPFGWSICFLLISISFSVWTQVLHSSSVQPQLHAWKSWNLLNMNCVPACCVSLSSSPVILFKDISYLVLLIPWPRFRCAHPMDFESNCQATVSLWLGIHLNFT